MSGPQYQVERQTTRLLHRLSLHSQHAVRLMTHSGLRNSALWPIRQPPNLPTRWNRKCIPGPNVVCPPKVPIYPHSATKPKPKFGRPLRIEAINYMPYRAINRSAGLLVGDINRWQWHTLWSSQCSFNSTKCLERHETRRAEQTSSRHNRRVVVLAPYQFTLWLNCLIHRDFFS